MIGLFGAAGFWRIPRRGPSPPSPKSRLPSTSRTGSRRTPPGRLPKASGAFTGASSCWSGFQKRKRTEGKIIRAKSQEKRLHKGSDCSTQPSDFPLEHLDMRASITLKPCPALLCSLALTLLSAGTTAGAEARETRPNILFCLADDWAWPHERLYGDKVVQTPAFDRVAQGGCLFTHAYSAAPSCTPSRAAILTGQAPHRLEEGASLYGFLPKKFPVYPDLLEKAGYAVGFSGKGWGPGNFQAGGRSRNPAGPNFKGFAEFLKTVPADKPFCFWFGSRDPHRAYAKGSGLKSGMKLEEVVVPPYLPDTEEVRSDILDYYFAVQRFDRDVGDLLQLLEASGKAANTLVVISGDNGWPFPRGKTNLYEAGTHQPLAIRWPARFKGGMTNDDFVNLADLAPTFLETAGLKPPSEMTGQSLLGLLAGKKQPGREAVFVERERHANVRKGDLSYPERAIRTT